VRSRSDDGSAGEGAKQLAGSRPPPRQVCSVPPSPGGVGASSAHLSPSLASFTAGIFPRDPIPFERF